MPVGATWSTAPTSTRSGPSWPRRGRWRGRAARVAGDKVVDVADVAAGVLAGLVQRHPFARRNRRVALVATLHFLNLNGWDLFLERIGEMDHLLDRAAAGAPAWDLAAEIRARLRSPSAEVDTRGHRGGVVLAGRAHETIRRGAQPHGRDAAHRKEDRPCSEVHRARSSSRRRGPGGGTEAAATATSARNICSSGLFPRERSRCEGARDVQDLGHHGPYTGRGDRR